MWLITHLERNSVRTLPLHYVRGAVLLAIAIGGWATCQVVYEAFQTSDVGYMLLLASDNGDTAMVKDLLQRGAGSDFEFKGMTPLKAARSGGHTAVVKLLEATGAKE